MHLNKQVKINEMNRSSSSSSLSSEISSTPSSSSSVWKCIETIENEHKLAEILSILPRSYSKQTNSNCAICINATHKMKQQYRKCGVENENEKFQ